MEDNQINLKMEKKMENQRKNALCKPLWLIILGFLILNLVAINPVSAFEFDNVKYYDVDTKTVTIKNFFGLGSTLVESKLITPQINYVIRGKDRKVAEFEISSKQDVNSFLKNIEFYNKKNNQLVNREFTLKYKIPHESLVDDIEKVCYNEPNIDITNQSNNNNNTLTCDDIVIGKKIKIDYTWQELSEKNKIELKKDENITIGIFTDVEAGDNIEWIPTFTLDSKDIRVEEWATWTDNFYTNLIAYYNFDEGTGTLLEDVHSHKNNGTLNNTPIWVDGKNGTALNFTGSNFVEIVGQELRDLGGTGKKILSVSYWLFYEGDLSDDYGTSVSRGTWDNNGFWGFRKGGAGDNKVYFDVFSLDNAGSNSEYNNQWINVVGVWDDTTIKIYINGVLNYSIASGPNNWGSYNVSTFIGMRNGVDRALVGRVDELSIYNRILNATEISELWNNGDGLFYINEDITSPDVIINFPLNTTYSSNSINFNVTALDDVGVDSCWYSLTGGAFNYTMTNVSTSPTQYNHTNSSIADGSYTANFYCKDSGNNINNSESVTFTLDTTEPTVTLNSPIENYNSSIISMIFNCSAYDNFNLVNVTLYGNWTGNFIANSTNSSGLNNSDYIFTNTIAEGYGYEWNCYACDNLNNCAFATFNRTFNIDLTAPIVNQANNLTNTTGSSFPISSNWNYTVEDSGISSCWYSTTDNSTNISISCNSNIQTNWTTAGLKGITYCANDSVGFETCRTDYLRILLIAYTQSESLDPVGIDTNVTYNLNLNVTGSDDLLATAYIYLNNTVYYPTRTINGSDFYNFSYSIVIPESWGTTTGNLINWSWNYTIEDYITNSSTSLTNTTVFSILIDNCSVSGYTILNLSLRDEEENSFVNISEDSNIEIDLSINSLFGTSYSYHEQWTNENNVSVCVPLGLLNNSNYTIDFTIGFSSEGRVNEFYYLDNGTLSTSDSFNSLTNRSIDLMDLLTADSTSFLFNYFDEDGLVVDDIIVHVFRKYIGEGLFREVERSSQNDDGETIVHLVEEDVIYYFVVSKYGEVLFTSNSYTALCQTTPCEIQLEESGGFQEFDNDWDLIDNGGYELTYDSLTRTVNLTYALTSASTMNLTVYKLNSDGAYESVGSEEEAGLNGDLIITVPTVSGNTSFFASIYQDNNFTKSEWIDFEEDAGLYLGNTLSLFLGALVILALGLMAVSEGGLVIVFLILGMFIAMALGLVDYRASTGLNILIYFVLAGGIILWKVTRRNR